MYTYNDIVNKHMHTVGWLMAPVYVEYVRWLKEKQDRLGLPVKIALRDGEAINFVAKQMAAIDPANFSVCNDWEPVWLNRYLIYRLGKNYEERNMFYHGSESERMFYGFQKVMSDWYMPKHGLDKTFIFADTGVRGGMSKHLNSLGYANFPEFMVSCSEDNELKYDYQMDSFGNYLRPILEREKRERPDCQSINILEIKFLIYLLDSLPKKTFPAWGFLNGDKEEKWKLFIKSKGKQELIWVRDFYAGLGRGVSMYMQSATKDDRFRRLLYSMADTLRYIHDVFAKNLPDESLNGLWEARDKGILWNDEQLLERRKILIAVQKELYEYGGKG